KLLHAVFGRAGEEGKNDRLEVPAGVECIVIDTQRFSRRASMTEDERKAFDKEQKEVENRFNKAIADQYRSLIAELGTVLEKRELKAVGPEKDDRSTAEQAVAFRLEMLDVRSPDRLEECRDIYTKHHERIVFLADEKERK